MDSNVHYYYLLHCCCAFAEQRERSHTFDWKSSAPVQENAVAGDAFGVARSASAAVADSCELGLDVFGFAGEAPEAAVDKLPDVTVVVVVVVEYVADTAVVECVAHTVDAVD